MKRLARFPIPVEAIIALAAFLSFFLWTASPVIDLTGGADHRGCTSNQAGALCVRVP